MSLWHNGTTTAAPVSTASLQTDLFFLYFSLSPPLSLFHLSLFLYLIFAFSLRSYLSRFHSCARFLLRSQSKESFCKRLYPVRDDAALTGVFVGLRILSQDETPMARPSEDFGNLETAVFARIWRGYIQFS